LRGRIGIVKQRFGNHSYTPFEVQFESNKQLELLWAVEFEESEEFYESRLPLFTHLPRRLILGNSRR